MALLLSSSNHVEERFSEKYVFPPRDRPGEHLVPAMKANVPVIDLQDHENNKIQHIMKASQDLGYFQVINHGISKDLVKEAMEVFKEIFKLPLEEKSKINMKDEETNKICSFYTSTFNYDIEETHYWRDALRHSCSPLEEAKKIWPQKPEKYREIVGELVPALKDVGSRILEHICEGLGLEPNYFAGDLSEDDYLIVNHYPPCPDPRMTLGLPKHSDPNLITILLQDDVPGLQVIDDEQWMAVETLPNALFVFVGNQLEIVSNRKLKSGVHRAVTNDTQARSSAAFFITPSKNSIVGPAKALVQPKDGPLFRSFEYKDFFRTYTDASDGDKGTFADNFKIKS